MKSNHSLLLVGALFAALLFTACPPQPQQGGDGKDSTAVDSTAHNTGHNYDAAVITLERSTCFGTCPSYTLRLDGTGKVDYNGRDFVAVKGAQTGQVTTEAFKALVDEFFTIGYFSLQDSFDSDITDVPHCITSIDVDGQQKRIFDRDGGPEALRKLEARIDSVANVQQWVKAPER